MKKLTKKQITRLKAIDPTGYERGKVDLRKCEKGDVLVSALGAIYHYEREIDKENPEDWSMSYYDHLTHEITADGKVNVKSHCTRTHDGYVFKMNRIPETDHDIVLIVKRNSIL